MKTIEIKDIEPELRKIVALDPQEWKKQINSYDWQTKGLKDYLLNLAN